MEARAAVPCAARIRRTACALSVAVVAVLIMVGIGACSDPLADGWDLIQAGDMAAAVATYRESLAKNAGDVKALSGLAVALMPQGEYEEALDIQERVIIADLADVQTRMELGFNYLSHQERAIDAVRVPSEAVELDGSARNLTFLAQAQERAGQSAAAEESLRTAIQVEPSYAYPYTVLVELLQNDQRHLEAARVKDLAKQNGLSLDTAQPAR